jgi:hypothetical protein
MKKIAPGHILPSAAYTVPRSLVKWCQTSDRAPEVGDVVYGSIEYIGEHSSLENKEGRIHAIHDGTRAAFVFGNRYAPDYYEGLVPDHTPKRLDLLARSGIVGLVKHRNARRKDPTRVKVLGYVVDDKGRTLNTRRFSKVVPRSRKKTTKRAKMILSIGTSMNSGKSMTAAACCWALRTMGHTVRGAKVTGTASLKDVLLMEDNGASPVADFTHLGFPSTYMLEEDDLLRIFNMLDLRFANNPKNYWVVEVADGILQRETAMLLRSDDVRSRIHRLIFSAHDAFGVIGGLRVLKDEFDLVPDAVSGVCSSSPLGIREFRGYTDVPVFNNVQRDLKQLADILL